MKYISFDQYNSNKKFIFLSSYNVNISSLKNIKSYKSYSIVKHFFPTNLMLIHSYATINHFKHEKHNVLHYHISLTHISEKYEQLKSINVKLKLKQDKALICYYSL